MAQRILRLINFKQYVDETFEIPEGLVVFIGKNGSGKSTAIQALESILLEKAFVKTPIRTGQEDAKIEYSGKDIDGNPIKILININSDGNYEFSAGIISGNKVKTIHDVKKIRELLGLYVQLTTEDVLAMIKYSEGRRKFISDYLLPLLTDVQRKRLAELQLSVSDKKTKATEGNLYNRRTVINKEVETLNIQISGAKLTDTEKDELTKKQAVIEYLNELETEYKLHSQDGVKFIEIKTQVERLERTWSNVSDGINTLSNEFKMDFSTELANINKICEKKDKELVEQQANLYTPEKITELSETIERGRTKKIYLESLEKKTEPTALIEQRDKKFAEILEIEKQIESNKAEIKAIFSNSTLPAGLQIDEETIILNDMVMDDTTTSNTESRLAIAELLCNISTAEYVQIGDVSLYDKESRKKLITLANKHNRIMIGQLVTDDSSVRVQTIIEK